MAQFIAWIYNKWTLIPEGVRFGLTALVVAVATVGLAFGWHFPNNWADAKAQVSAFWLVLAPIAWNVFQNKIWPPLFAWIVSLLNMYYYGDHKGRSFLGKSW